MIKSKVGFIGTGYMGYGMAKNLIKNFDVYVIAHKNRKPIEKLVKLGATEVISYKQLFSHILDCLMMCVTNTPIANIIAKEIVSIINNELLIIDLTTHHQYGAIEINNIFKSKEIKYTVSPVMCGPVQSEEGVLGGIWGGDSKNFYESKTYLQSFCKQVFNFGSLEKATQAKFQNFNAKTIASLILIGAGIPSENKIS